VKYLNKYISLIIIILTPIFVHSQQEKVYKTTDLIRIINQSKYDTNVYLERLAAKEFHHLLNEYRISKTLDTVAWSEEMWLACRNHSVYMIFNNTLTHSEETDKQFFTGESPGDRLHFVQVTLPRFSWCGENALYNYSCSGKTLQEKAKNIAKYSFQQWKNSPGHNENMLSKAPQFHAVAFKIKGQLVYATSLFGYKLSNNNYPLSLNIAESEFKTDQSENNQTLSQIKTENNNPKKINCSKEQKSQEELFINSLGVENKIKVNNKKMDYSAKKHCLYMSTNNKLSHNEDITKKNFYGQNRAMRMARAEGKRFWFLTFKTEVKEYIINFQLTEDEYNKQYCAQEIFEQLVNKNNIDLTTINSYGLCIKLNKSKGIINVWGVFLLKD